MRITVLLIFLVACAVDGGRDVSVFLNGRAHLTPTISLAYRSGLEVELDGKTVDRIPLVVGAPAVMPIEGRHCTVRITALDPGDPEASNPVPVVRARFTCDEGMAPGADATKRGSRSRVAVLWALPALAMGILTGLLARRKTTPPLVVLAAMGGMLVAAVVPAILIASGIYIASSIALGLGFALPGFAVLNAPKSGGIHPLDLLALVAPAVVFAVIWPAWSPGAPLAAIGIGAVALVASFTIRDWVTKRP